jgi:hypothetical protein
MNYPSIYDINSADAVRDFTSDPVTFPGDEMRAFIEELVCWCFICSALDELMQGYFTAR